MLPIERLNNIKKILSEKKQMDVSTLAQTLSVTETTIRRDLEKLENENFITRTHGGAVLNETPQAAVSLFQAKNENTLLYTPISKIASNFVHDNAVIFLGPGVSSRYIARELHKKINVTLVTTDIMVAHDCALYSPQVSVIIAGGNLNTVTLQLSGRVTDSTLKTFFFDYSFLDIDGISLERGYSVDSLDKSYLTRDILELSKKSFAVCTYTAFNKESSSVVGNIRLFEALITNEQAPNEYKEFFFQNNIQIYAAFDAFRD
ncbi:DeoR/GlpR family DNA-binding transcription regulator [Muricomes intestini]|uniref:DeoR/GlpR family DNA-binding transcription regulator n=1 Tax=Muricomes intestini TaxID=1796634 RepID=UPI0026ABAA48